MKKTLKITKTTLKTISLMLAVVFACMPLVTFANADALTGESRIIATDYRITTEFIVGREYVIVGGSTSSSNLGNNYALTTSICSNDISATPVTVSIDGYIHEQVSEACVWTAVERGDYVCLKNNLTGKYLGSHYDVYTWDSIYGADAVDFSRGGFSMNFIGSTGIISSSKLHFDEARNKFYLASQQSPWNVNIYEKVETAVLLTPFEG